MNHTFSIIEGECDLDDDLPAELDFSKLRVIRHGLPNGALGVVIEPELAAVFADSNAVNQALRELPVRRQSEQVSAVGLQTH
ncbi:MAG: hypothetical protein ACRD82_06710 [Blastocatellia bacterium]